MTFGKVTMKYVVLTFYIVLLFLLSVLLFGVIKFVDTNSLLSIRPDYWAATYVFMIAITIQIIIYQVVSSFNGMYLLQIFLVGLLLYLSVIFHLKQNVSVIFGVAHILSVIAFFSFNVINYSRLRGRKSDRRCP
jgi:hypothetical protein